MTNNFNNFNNFDESMRKSPIIQERMSLITTHMYKQYLEYEKANMNMSEVFSKMKDNIDAVMDYFRQAFSSRGISSQNFHYELDSNRSVMIVSILWHQFSIVTRYNDCPQALQREQTPLFVSRIIAIKGNYFDIIKKSKETDIDAILEYEIASLYVPSEKSQNAIMKIKHLSNKELPISQVDAPRDFLLKVIELTCGGGLFHKEGVKKNITIDL